jgi:signal peptide peptidase SppA
MPKHYEHVVSFAVDHPWALTRSMTTLIAELLASRLAGEDVDRAVVEQALVNRKNLPQPTAGSVAIVPVYGVLAPRANMMSEMSGGTTFEHLTSLVRGAMSNPAIKTIVLDVDSPGGNVAGATEFARELLAARTKKPIIAVAQYTMASAAYWLASCCTSVYAAPSAQVGSIGVFSLHEDMTDALALRGIKRRFVSAGVGKTDGIDALTPTAEQRLQGLVDQSYASFVGDVVKGRGTGLSEAKVRQDWQAHIYHAEDALAMGMIDRIATVDETVNHLLGTADSKDQRAALTYAASTDTAQEPSRVTAQDRSADRQLEQALFDLTLRTRTP